MYGGFLDAQFVEDFAYYADTAFRELGHLVRHWVTVSARALPPTHSAQCSAMCPACAQHAAVCMLAYLPPLLPLPPFPRFLPLIPALISSLPVCSHNQFNEPMSICQLGYGTGVHAPGVAGGTRAQLKCGHHLLLAHARVAALYRGKYRPLQRGRLGLAVSAHWARPVDPASEADAAAAEAYVQAQLAWIADPIYLGDYPAPLRAAHGAALPRFTPEQRAALNGSLDFLGLNLYTAHYVKAPPPGAPKSQLYEEALADARGAPPGPPTGVPWAFETPWALRQALEWLSRRYARPELWVTENGAAVPGEAALERAAALDDRFRVGFFSSYLDELCRAVGEGGARVAAYFAWSLLDGVEWAEGLEPRFGIVRVDRARGLKRAPKLSAHWLSRHFFKLAPHEIPCLDARACGADNGGGGGDDGEAARRRLSEGIDGIGGSGGGGAAAPAAAGPGGGSRGGSGRRGASNSQRQPQQQQQQQQSPGG